MTVWKTRKVEVLLFLLWLAAAGTVYAPRDSGAAFDTQGQAVEAHSQHLLWISSIGFVGFYLLAVPSITQVLTWFHAILFEWRWELFLSDPFVFLFLDFHDRHRVLWGRGMFCGWMCPYGSYSRNWSAMGRQILGLKRYQRHLLPKNWQ